MSDQVFSHSAHIHRDIIVFFLVSFVKNNTHNTQMVVRFCVNKYLGGVLLHFESRKLWKLMTLMFIQVDIFLKAHLVCMCVCMCVYLFVFLSFFSFSLSLADLKCCKSIYLENKRFNYVEWQFYLICLFFSLISLKSWQNQTFYVATDSVS